LREGKHKNAKSKKCNNAGNSDARESFHYTVTPYFTVCYVIVAQNETPKLKDRFFKLQGFSWSLYISEALSVKTGIP
jgi:hypothetical protein